MWGIRLEFRHSRLLSRILLTLTFVFSVVPAHAAKTADITGVIVTVDASHVQTLWPNAKITLRSLETKAEVSTVSGALGDYKFAGVLFGDYEVRDGAVVFTHTEVEDAFEGQGVGSTLVKAALDNVRELGGRGVRTLCPFVRSWIDRHPDYADLVGPGNAGP